MRVISGTKRGHILHAPKGQAIRPTSERVRGALFGILGTAVADARVLDLFAGTGALGIEALSRGAGSALFVDLDKRAVRTIRDNLERLGLESCSEVWKTSYGRALRKLGGQGCRFDLVFFDPPYEGGWTENVLYDLMETEVVAEEGIVIAEHWKKTPTPEPPPRLSLLTERTYGETKISIWRVS